MHQIEHYELAEQRAVGLTLRAGCQIRVSHGRLWLTQPDQKQDVWLSAGECWTQSGTGLVWLSAEPHARFELAQVLHNWLPGWARRWAWPLQTLLASQSAGASGTLQNIAGNP